MDGGSEEIEDAEVKRIFRRQALKVYVEASFAGAVLTALFVIVPF